MLTKGTEFPRLIPEVGKNGDITKLNVNGVSSPMNARAADGGRAKFAATM